MVKNRGGTLTCLHFTNGTCAVLRLIGPLALIAAAFFTLCLTPLAAFAAPSSPSQIGRAQRVFPVPAHHLPPMSDNGYAYVLGGYYYADNTLTVYNNVQVAQLNSDGTPSRSEDGKGNDAISERAFRLGFRHLQRPYLCCR